MSRFRLVPDAQQEAALTVQCDQSRFVWNLGLEQRSQYRTGRGPTPGFAEQCRQLTEARADSEWLAAGSQTVQQQALRDLDQAFANFFAGSHRYPTWRRKSDRQGFRIVGPQATRVEKRNHKWAQVLVPKVGWVTFRLSRALPKDARSYRVTRDRAGRWHIAFALQPDPIPAPGTGETVGVDRGVIVSAALSTGELLRCPGLTPGEQERLRRLRRRLARARRGSNRRRALVTAIARLMAREADRRKNWVEQTSTHLAQGFDLIGLEELKTRQMTRSAKGTLERPGSNVRQKAGLNREILTSGWGLLQQRLQDKAGDRLVLVPPAYTSQTCNVCGHVSEHNRESQAVFSCTACGHALHADVNAARNIRDFAVAARTTSKSRTAAGRAVTGRGASPLGRVVKRQPSARVSSAPAA